MAKQAFVADMAGKDGACVVKVKAEGGLRAADDPETQAAIIAASDPCIDLTVAAHPKAVYGHLSDDNEQYKAVVGGFGFNGNMEDAYLCLYWRYGCGRVKAMKIYGEDTRHELLLERNGVDMSVNIGTCLQSGDVVATNTGEAFIVEKVVLDFNMLETAVANMARSVTYSGMMACGFYGWELGVREGFIGVKPFVKKALNAWWIFGGLVVWIWLLRGRFAALRWRLEYGRLRTVAGLSGKLVFFTLACLVWECNGEWQNGLPWVFLEQIWLAKRMLVLVLAVIIWLFRN
jgi:hypothetical protein